MPKLWNQTIQDHRREVRDTTLDSTAALVAEQGLLSVTMSQIAERTGIGRATLYKYFPDVEAILLAWHERQIAGHLDELASVRDRAGPAGERLRAVLEAYAVIAHQSHGHHDSELAAFLHRDDRVARAQLAGLRPQRWPVRRHGRQPWRVGAGPWSLKISINVAWRRHRCCGSAPTRR